MRSLLALMSALSRHFPGRRKSPAPNWLATLQQQTEIAERAAIVVPRILSHPNLTTDQALRLRQLLKSGAKDFNHVVEPMEYLQLDESLHSSAEALRDLWSRLSDAADHKVIVLKSRNAGSH